MYRRCTQRLQHHFTVMQKPLPLPTSIQGYLPISAEDLPDKLELIIGGALYIHREEKPILTKTDLVVHYRLSDNRALRSQVFTDEVLLLIGMDKDTYKATGRFNLYQSAKIYEVLKITWLRTGLKVLTTMNDKR